MRNASSVWCAAPTTDDVHRVVAQADAVDVGRGAHRVERAPTGRVGERNRHRGVGIDPCAELVEAPEDLRVTPQQAGDEDGEQHEHDRLDREERAGHCRFLLHRPIEDRERVERERDERDATRDERDEHDARERSVGERRERRPTRRRRDGHAHRGEIDEHVHARRGCARRAEAGARCRRCAPQEPPRERREHEVAGRDGQGRAAAGDHGGEADTDLDQAEPGDDDRGHPPSGGCDRVTRRSGMRDLAHARDREE